MRNRIANLIIFLAGLLFYVFYGFCLGVEAETVTLKSGRILEGEIIERGDGYLRIQTDSGVIKVSNKLLSDQPAETASGRVLPGRAEISVEAMIEKLGEELSAAQWEERLSAYDAYFRAVGGLQRQHMTLLAESTRQINEAVKKKDFSKAHQVAKRIRGNIAYLQRELEKINALEELNPYHDSVAQVFHLTIRSINAWLMGDQQSYYRYHRDSYRAMISSMDQYAVFSDALGTGNRAREYMQQIITVMKKNLQDMYY